ncbi:hypothetical protein PUN28_018135 [Cardiocondyla obscurior]|uniref:Uncharacterized protein n=1 Tax=Cardiocondyla obscurior TaxID=286306 RepID=A0AAW2EIR1_9HYME
MKGRVISRPPERGRCSLQEGGWVGGRGRYVEDPRSEVGARERKRQRVVASSSSDHAATSVPGSRDRSAPQRPTTACPVIANQYANERFHAAARAK